MNHQETYRCIIKSSQNKNRKKLKKTDIEYIYYENHHINPRCLGGTDEKENLVLLTSKEHFVCHKLLTYIYPHNRGIILAFHRMVFSKNGYIPNSRNYAYLLELLKTTPFSEETKQKIRNKRKLQIVSTGWHHSEESKNINRIKHLKENLTSEMLLKMKKPKSEEHKKKLSEANKGFIVSNETKLKISNANKGKIPTKETKLKISNSKKGQIFSEEHRKKLSEAHLGKKRNPHSEETKLKIKNSNMGKKHKMKTKIINYDESIQKR
jgi:hypothetical protein